MLYLCRTVINQNNLLSVKVIANQTVVHANATARSNVAKANGESQAIKIITAQLKQSPQYLQWLSINRWNGQLPYALSGAVPFFQLPRITMQQNQSNSSSTFTGGH
jgi:prohibitin 2